MITKTNTISVKTKEYTTYFFMVNSFLWIQAVPAPSRIVGNDLAKE